MNSTRMIDDERDTLNSEEREKFRNSNLHLVIKVFFQFFPDFILLFGNFRDCPSKYMKALSVYLTIFLIH